MEPQVIPGLLDELLHCHRVIDYSLCVEFEKSTILA